MRNKTKSSSLPVACLFSVGEVARPVGEVIQRCRSFEVGGQLYVVIVVKSENSLQGRVRDLFCFGPDGLKNVN